MKSVTHSIFKTFLLSVLVVAQMHFAYAQTASILPPAKTTFLDANGKPLTAGTVESFIPATNTHKTTWQDAAETIPNANPLTLDAAGRTLLLGSGSYRQLVKDRLGNVIWDQVTSSTGSGGTGPTATGDGDLVGTIKPWAGMTAPNQYVFTYGQELSRTTYSALFTAITSTQPVFCNSGSPILNGLSDTTNFWIGMTVEISCVAAGFSTIISKTATTVTVAANANVTVGTNAIFFPWGRGNGSTTFNMPDFRGFVLAGNDNMGGIAANNLTTTFYATNPNSIGAAGGNQSHAIILSEMAGHNHSITDPGHTHLATAVSTSGNQAGGGTAASAVTPNSLATSSSTTGITITSNGGGIAVSATIAAVGSGYTNGAQTITIAGGTCTIQPQFTVTIAGNIFTSTPVLLTAGSCTIAPTNPAATTGGGGTGGTLNVTYSAQPISLIQPTKTSNYIIKVTPDDNSATASGVTALGGMTGSIACGTGTLCTGNTISVSPIVVNSTTISGGTDTRILFDNVGILGEYPISGTTSVCMTTSCAMTTPSLGVATATSINKVAITAPATSATLTIPDGVTLIGPAASGTAMTLGNAEAVTGAKTFGATGNVGKLVVAGATSGTTVLNATAVASGTITLPATTDTLVATATVNTLTNKTIDTAGTGNHLQISGVDITRGQILGEASNAAATAANIGEFISSTVLQGSAVSLTTATPANITSISLTAGDWDVWGSIAIVPSSTVTIYEGWISTTSASIPTFPNNGAIALMQLAFASATQQIIPVGRERISLSGTTTVFLSAAMTFAGTCTGYGFIGARRAR